MAHFGVGTITIGGQELAKCTGIRVMHDGSPVEFYAGDYALPDEIFLGNKVLEITIDDAQFAVDETTVDTILDDTYVTVVLDTGDRGGGFTSTTFLRCKVISYEVTSEQESVIACSMVLRKARTT